LPIPDSNNVNELGGTPIRINQKMVKEIKALYTPMKTKIRERLNKFKEIWREGDEHDVFTELVFCLLTLQSKARSCDTAVGCLLRKDLLIRESSSKIARELKGRTRFHNNKASYIVHARKKFTRNGTISIKSCIASLGDPKEVREWLVSNVKGLGYKEASHFLRNIGFGEDLAILDRHILKNLLLLGIIQDMPDSISKIKYHEIEEQMREFSNSINIPLAHLDLLLWYKETGEIFK
jgi:N-glycosylase/DNA lyase